MTSLSTPAGLSDRDYERFRDFLGLYSGLHYPPSRRNDLAHGLAKALRESDHRSLDDLYERLTRSGGRGPEMDRLVSTLTVGETYFFRIDQHFQALTRDIFPRLIAERARSSRRLRIWSAGCAGGEEAYSLAIALRQCLPNVETWNVTILGTDIDQEALRKARAGTYSEWSFREMDPAVRSAYFTQDGKRWRIRDEIKKMVEFHYLNLVEDNYPSLTTNTNAMDVIFCRNVTIYFSEETTNRVVRNLHRALVDQGYLFVGASEPNLVTYNDFRHRRVSGAVVYQKTPEPERRPGLADLEQMPRFDALSAPQAPGPPAEPSAATEPVDADLSEFESARVRMEAGDLDGAMDALYKQIEVAPDHGPSYATLAKLFANQGQLEQAQHWCERAIGADRLNAEAHYVLALIYDEQGLRDKATESLRRTLFLDRDHVLAHYVLGNLYRQSGKQDMALKAWRNAADILKQRGTTELVPDSDGMTTGRLLEVIEAQLAEMARA